MSTMQANKRPRVENSLMNWARDQNANIENLKMINEDGEGELDRCIIAGKAIDEGEEICFIPSSMLLSVSVALQTKLGQAIQEAFQSLDDVVSSKYAHAIDIIALSAFMVQQTQANKSFWSPYLKTLPKEYTLPICWKDESIKTLLKGTGLEFITLERKKWLKRVVEHLNSEIPAELFPSGKVTNEEFLWAFCSITSRAFPKSQTSAPEGGDGDRSDWMSLSEICLYPVLDMLNHKRNQKIEWVMRNDGVSFIAREKVHANTELFNNYGSKGNENLLGNYGFVLEDNPEDYFKLVMNTRPDDSFAKSRKEALDKRELSLIHMIFQDDIVISEKLLDAADVMVAGDVELRKLRKGHYQSPKLRLSSLRTLSTLLREKLRLASEHIDEESVDETDYVKMLARVYRGGQQVILKHYLAILALSETDLIASCSILNIEDTKSTLLEKLKDHSERIDDFTMTALLLIELSQEPPLSLQGPMKILLGRLPCDARDCRHTLGKEYQGDFKEFYSQEVVALQNEYPELLPKSLFTKDACLWAFTVLILHFFDELGLIFPFSSN